MTPDGGHEAGVDSGPPARSSRDRVLEQGDEPVGLVEMREVAGALEQLKPTARHQLVRAPPLLDRDDPVARAPHDQQRQLGGQIQPVDGLDALAADVDARAQCVDEGRTALGIS